MTPQEVLSEEWVKSLQLPTHPTHTMRVRIPVNPSVDCFRAKLGVLSAPNCPTVDGLVDGMLNHVPNPNQPRPWLAHVDNASSDDDDSDVDSDEETKHPDLPGQPHGVPARPNESGAVHKQPSKPGVGMTPMTVNPTATLENDRWKDAVNPRAYQPPVTSEFQNGIMVQR